MVLSSFNEIHWWLQTGDHVDTIFVIYSTWAFEWYVTWHVSDIDLWPRFLTSLDPCDPNWPIIRDLLNLSFRMICHSTWFRYWPLTPIPDLKGSLWPKVAHYSRSTQPELLNDMSHGMCLILTFDPNSWPHWITVTQIDPLFAIYLTWAFEWYVTGHGSDIDLWPRFLTSRDHCDPKWPIIRDLLNLSFRMICHMTCFWYWPLTPIPDLMGSLWPKLTHYSRST